MLDLQMTNKIEWMVAEDIEVGEVANQVASKHLFTDYLSRRPQNTVEAQRTDLRTYCTYLISVNQIRTADQLMSDADSWAGTTWGMVSGFTKWMLGKGYAVATINHALSTVKVYVTLASQAGAITMDEMLRIKNVKSFTGRDAKVIDAGRDVARRSNKKSTSTSITDEQADSLKLHPDTPQGRRDRLMMCLLIDHGLRAGELSALRVSDINMTDGVMTFDRPKVDCEQTHKLSADTVRALHAYINSGDCPTDGYLLRGSRKGGKLDGNGMSEVAITIRVKQLGEAVGIDNLSAHDMRHYWATRWANKVDLFRLQEAGGWSSLSMPRRYVEKAKIANEGMA